MSEFKLLVTRSGGRKVPAKLVIIYPLSICRRFGLRFKVETGKGLIYGGGIQ